MCPLCRRYRVVSQERTSIRKTFRKQYEISGRDIETESEPMPEWVADEGAYSRKAYWRMANSGVVKRALTKERLINWGYYDLATACQSMHVNY